MSVSMVARTHPSGSSLLRRNAHATQLMHVKCSLILFLTFKDCSVCIKEFVIVKYAISGISEAAFMALEESCLGAE